MKRELTTEMRECLRVAAGEMGLSLSETRIARLNYGFRFGHETTLSFRLSGVIAVRDVIYNALLIRGVMSQELHIDQRPVTHKETA